MTAGRTQIRASSALKNPVKI